ncbi:WecB/TagA/CpsF family glycosyltransferase [Candidatus Sumerlaeota bacterium]|nr:WecB/TagA/CpsF family glycosyltransferase [Candidatus Sumerlaeota bacterium]
MSLKLTPCGVDELVDWLTLPDPATVPPRAVGYLNAHTVNLSHQDGTLKQSMNKLDVVYADGMAVVKEARLRGIVVRERVSAADFLVRFLWVAASRGRPIALVGGKNRLAEKCAMNLRELVPKLEVVLVHDGFFMPGSPEEKEVVDQLCAARPAIVLLGMGSPRQEAFALRLRDEARLPTVWCVGALFEYFTPGVRRHAPLWMRERGLEWLFRLMQEPRRMARRYVIGNIRFLFRCLSFK